MPKRRRADSTADAAARLQGDERYLVLAADGDCGYACFVTALSGGAAAGADDDDENGGGEATAAAKSSSSGGGADDDDNADDNGDAISVAVLRQRVAAALTQDHYDALLVAFQQNPRDYS